MNLSEWLAKRCPGGEPALLEYADAWRRHKDAHGSEKDSPPPETSELVESAIVCLRWSATSTDVYRRFYRWVFALEKSGAAIHYQYKGVSVPSISKVDRICREAAMGVLRDEPRVEHPVEIHRRKLGLPAAGLVSKLRTAIRRELRYEMAYHGFATQAPFRKGRSDARDPVFEEGAPRRVVNRTATRPTSHHPNVLAESLGAKTRAALQTQHERARALLLPAPDTTVEKIVETALSREDWTIWRHRNDGRGSVAGLAKKLGVSTVTYRQRRSRVVRRVEQRIYELEG